MEPYTTHGEDEKLLDHRSSSEESFPTQPRHLPAQQTPQSSNRIHKVIIFTLTITLVASNLLWASLPAACTNVESQKAYYGSPATTRTAFNHEWRGLWQQENDTYRYREEEWGDKLFPDDGGVVALSAQFVEENNLPKAAVALDDPDKMIYLVAGYHQLHCASVVRKAIYFLNGTMPHWPDPGGFLRDHVLHCMDAVRQGLVCNLDDTLIPLDRVWPGIPSGQLHSCRNRDALHSWCNERGHDIPIDPKALDEH